MADALGRNYHSGRLDAGTTLTMIAQDFAGSAAFLATYDSLSNSQFINQLYLNVLHRTADARGLSYWTGLLNAGTSRAEVTLGVTESAEFQVNILWQIDNGIVLL